MADRSLGYEGDNIKARAPIIVGTVIALTIVLSFLLCFYFFDGLMKLSESQDEEITLMHSVRELPEGPLLETDQGSSLRILQQRESRILNSYGRLPDDSYARVPISRAKEYFLENPGVGFRKVVASDEEAPVSNSGEDKDSPGETVDEDSLDKSVAEDSPEDTGDEEDSSK